VKYKNLKRIERLEQMILWDKAHAAATDFALRLTVILNKEEWHVMAAHCQTVKGTSELLKFTDDPMMDKILAKVNRDVIAREYYFQMCRLVEAWNRTQSFI
jgi:hypothetical protein